MKYKILYSMILGGGRGNYPKLVVVVVVNPAAGRERENISMVVVELIPATGREIEHIAMVLLVLVIHAAALERKRVKPAVVKKVVMLVMLQAHPLERNRVRFRAQCQVSVCLNKNTIEVICWGKYLINNRSRRSYRFTYNPQIKRWRYNLHLENLFVVLTSITV